MFLKLFPLYAPMLWAGDAGDGGGATDTGAGDPPGDPPAPTGGAAPAGQPGGATFTQADLDRIAGQTRKEALAKWVKDHGYASVAEAETAIKAQKEAQDQAKTDLEKARERETTEKTRAEVAEARLFGVVLRSAFDRLAAGKIADDLIDAAYLTAKEGGMLNGDSGIQVDVDKNSVVGMDKVVEKLLKEKPSFKKIIAAAPAGTGGADGGNTPPGTTPEQEDATRRTYGIKPRRK
jgi:hypothetical protein